jgi:ArsR family transcriptional regulator
MNGSYALDEARPPILDTATLLADTTRCRILQVLEDQELTVSELCSILQLPQSTVSRHLRLLADDQWVQSRRDGTSNLYRPAAVNGAAGSLWRLIREQLSTHAAVQRDRHRLKGVLRERISRSEQFFASSAGEWDRLRDELFGDRFDLLATTWLLGGNLTIGDLACGTGRVAEALAPAVGRILAIDQSEGMLEAAHRRLDDFENVELREGRLESLPIADGALDVATLFLALHLSPDPVRVLSEARRVLRPGGRLLVVDLLPHGREELRQEMGHVWLGFSKDQMVEYLRQSGFSTTAASPFRYSPLPAVPSSSGPGLFVAVAGTEIP